MNAKAAIKSKVLTGDNSHTVVAGESLVLLVQHQAIFLSYAACGGPGRLGAWNPKAARLRCAASLRAVRICEDLRTRLPITSPCSVQGLTGDSLATVRRVG